MLKRRSDDALVTGRCPRQPLRVLYAEVAETARILAERHGCGPASTLVLAEALTAEPLHDELHSRMLICLAAMGRRHEVVDHYRRYRELLRNELGLDPPSEIRQLYARLII